MVLDVLCYTMLDLRWFIQNMGFCPLWLISLAQTSHQLMHWSKFLVAILVFFQSGLKIHKLCICLNSYFVNLHMYLSRRKKFYISFTNIFTIQYQKNQKSHHKQSKEGKLKINPFRRGSWFDLMSELLGLIRSWLRAE